MIGSGPNGLAADYPPTFRAFHSVPYATLSGGGTGMDYVWLGGGGRPSDTDMPVASALDAEAFRLWAGLTVPRIGVANCIDGHAP